MHDVSHVPAGGGDWGRVDAISKMVVTGLSAPQVQPAPVSVAVPVNDASKDYAVDPNNPKIITTAAEMKLLSILKDMLSGVVSPD